MTDTLTVTYRAAYVTRWYIETQLVPDVQRRAMRGEPLPTETELLNWLAGIAEGLPATDYTLPK